MKEESQHKLKLSAMLRLSVLLVARIQGLGGEA